MNALRDPQGAALVTIALLPLLLLVLAGVLQLGALRVAAVRVRAAADLAALVAVNDQDDGELVRTGALWLAVDAAEVAREYLARELELSAPLLAAPAHEIAASASIAAFPGPGGIDSETGARYERPTVRIAMDVPLRAPVFGVVMRPAISVGVLAVGSAR